MARNHLQRAAPAPQIAPQPAPAVSVDGCAVSTLISPTHTENLPVFRYLPLVFKGDRGICFLAALNTSMFLEISASSAQHTCAQL